MFHAIFQNISNGFGSPKMISEKQALFLTAVQIEYPFPSGKVISRSTRYYLLDVQIMILQKMIQYKTKYNEQLEREVKKKTRSLISYDYNYYL